MSEVEPYTEEDLRDKVAYGCPDCARLLATIEAYKAEVAAMKGAMIPVRIDCPECGTPHVDEGEWATRPHRTHQCQQCGHEWRPYPVATVGIAPSAEVEGARNAGLEAAANYAERREAAWEENYRTYGHAEQHHKFSAARSIIDGIRALKTTPTGGE